ncbi:hypothetical protein [Prosthecobacter sp.]|uniref:hypothetical protein n=1 Tax=Prosthecobacter sp. TaxID=1965333 RepID=UPI002489E50A|nr:hypothetical protein [Prosthecobacter sp.]MDI1311835.1 hypothetical protein [Prosthecobacter sp.]
MLTGLSGALLPDMNGTRLKLCFLFWAISRDLQRYQPLVRVSGLIMVIAGPAYLSIDLQCPLPLGWVLMDSAG